MPDNAGRDPEEVAKTLSAWLATKLPAGAGPEVAGVNAPTSNGFSNETILCRATWTDPDGRRTARRLVVRVAPTRHLLFLDAHFSTQYRVMKTLADAGAGVPLPPLGWYEEDLSWLGVPFFTMDHVDGLVPPDNLPYTMEGWVIEAAPAQQERMWWTGLEAMAAVHRTDWRRLDLDWLGGPGRGRPGLEQQLAYYREFLDWSAKGRPQPVAEAIWQWLVDNRPAETGDVVLCWGDSRVGNMIWQDFTPVAVLDWEMATLGQPELDLGWWLYFDRQFTEGLGVPRPPGFPSHEATVERYAELIGRPVGNLDYYQAFSGFRFAVVMCRLTDLLVESGQLPEDTDMGTNNLATQFTAQLLGLPSPAG
ncbi:MAG TPA: phosphotransferase family protein [Acidimicrobiales bacterium]|nr:phosphotransferase family protein [Acidimicrobiales bacterium]